MTTYEKIRAELYKTAGQTVRELFDRRSVRAFTDQKISKRDKETILYAAAEAPSAGCQQLYTVLDITDPALKEKLSETCDHQPFIAKAPMVLVFCTDCLKWYDAFQKGDCSPREPGCGDLLLAITDTAIAAQNAVTAAWSLGIGSCYIGDILEQNEEQRRLLRLPDYVVPTVMVVFGYPTEQQKTRKKPVRIDMDGLVFENAYPSFVDREKQLENRCDPDGYAAWIKRFCERKYNSDFSVEMSRSAQAYLKTFKEY